MKLTIKILNGEGTTVDVDESETISTVKNIVAERLKIPPPQQRLIYKGKTLTDSSSLHSNGITSGERLYLSIRKEQKETMNVRAPCDEIDLWEKMRSLLRSHFTDTDAELVLGKFREDFGTWIAHLSLDDIERMAQFHMNAENT